MRFVRRVGIKFTDNLPAFPIMTSSWPCLKLLLICLLEPGFGSENSLPLGLFFGKLRCYRSLDRSGNPRVKDPMGSVDFLHGHHITIADVNIEVPVLALYSRTASSRQQDISKVLQWFTDCLTVLNLMFDTEPALKYGCIHILDYICMDFLYHQ